jgi:hypothetical protein
MARPSKLKPEILEILLEAIGMGLTFKAAAQLAGIDETTYHRWKRKGRAATSGPYHQFYQSLRKAEIVGQAALLKNIHDASEGGQPIITTRVTSGPDGQVIKTITHQRKALPDWKAAAWLLERRFPAEWGRQERSQDNGDVKDPLEQWMEDLNAAARAYLVPEKTALEAVVAPSRALEHLIVEV